MNGQVLDNFVNIDCSVPDDVLKSYKHIDDNIENLFGDICSRICFGCACEISCSNNNQCICITQHGHNYDSQGRLLFIDELLHDPFSSKPIFECNSCCSCTQDCSNRVVQNGLKLKLQIYPTVDKGFGVRALQDVLKGTYVIDYAGEVLPKEEALKRIALKKATENNYLLTVMENYGSKYIRTDIDAARYGNVSRFINHSCDPNLAVHPVRVDSVVPRLALFAIADISAGTELSFDYSGGIKDVRRDELTTRRICKCLSANCKGHLPAHGNFD